MHPALADALAKRRRAWGEKNAETLALIKLESQRLAGGREIKKPSVPVRVLQVHNNGNAYDTPMFSGTVTRIPGAE